MNYKLVESLFQIIQSLEHEERELLDEKIKTLSNHYQVSQKNDFSGDNRFKAIKEWAESHSYNTTLLSDEAVSRRGIYE